MYAYVYQAELLCGDCALLVGRQIAKEGKVDVIHCENSDYFPQGPHLDGGGEADTPQHCGGCGKFLENPLTPDGYAYVQKAIEACKRFDQETIPIREWREFYKPDEFPDEAA